MDGIKAIADAIRVMASITFIGKDSLNLKDNSLGNEGWGAIFAAVCDSRISKITSIDASGERIGPEGAMLIGQALRSSVNASITVVDLRFNKLDSESATILANIAKEKKISLCGIKPEQTEADFTPSNNGYNAMQSADAILLTADLTVRASLTSVNLLGNRFDTKAASMLLKVKEEKPMLRTVYGLTHAETELSYSRQCLGPADAMLLAPEISLMASLTSVRYAIDIDSLNGGFGVERLQSSIYVCLVIW